MLLSLVPEIQGRSPAGVRAMSNGQAPPTTTIAAPPASSWRTAARRTARRHPQPGGHERRHDEQCGGHLGLEPEADGDAGKDEPARAAVLEPPHDEPQRRDTAEDQHRGARPTTRSRGTDRADGSAGRAASSSGPSWRSPRSRGQLADLRSAAADLVGGDDLGHVLQRIVERAATAVLARGYLLAVARGAAASRSSTPTGWNLRRCRRSPPTCWPGRGPRSCPRGGRRCDLLASPPQAGSPPCTGRSSRASRTTGPPCAAMRGHTAAAVDMMTALQDSRRDAERARALLDLARQAGRGGPAEGHRPRRRGGPARDRRLRRGGTCGYVGRGESSAAPRGHGRRHGWLGGHGRHGRHAESSADGATGEDAVPTISPEAIPEMARFLTDPQPLVVSTSTVSPEVARILAARGLEQVIAVPLLVEGRLHGVAAAGWRNAVPAACGVPTCWRGCRASGNRRRARCATRR